MGISEQCERSVSAVAVIDLANELKERNGIHQESLRDLGSEFWRCYEAWGNNEPLQERRLPERLLTQLWSIAVTSIADPEVGLDIGLKVNHHAKGLLANWVVQCHSLAESFDTFSQNIHLLNPSEHWRRVDDGDKVKLVLEFDSLDYPDIAIDRSMTTIISWSSELSGNNVKPLAATFTRPRPEVLAKYRSIFGDNLDFDHHENTLVFSKEIFNQASKTGNPYLKELIRKEALEFEASLMDASSLRSMVGKLFRQDLARFSQVDAVCEALHLSRSTLYRKLKAESTSFTELLKEARMIKLKKLEKLGVGQSMMAEMLGFQDTGSYYRFRREHPPSNPIASQ